MTSLFVLDLTYAGNLDQVDALMADHRKYLKQHYEAGIFLASGRKEPRTGGVILAAGSQGEIEKIIGQDPFAQQGVAEYAVTEFLPTMTGAALEQYKIALP